MTKERGENSPKSSRIEPLNLILRNPLYAKENQFWVHGEGRGEGLKTSSPQPAPPAALGGEGVRLLKSVCLQQEQCGDAPKAEGRSSFFGKPVKRCKAGRRRSVAQTFQSAVSQNSILQAR